MFAHSLSTDSRQDPKPTGINNAFFVDYDASWYALELWQSEWDEFPENKLRQIFPHLKDCTACPRTSRKEETVISGLYIGHSDITRSFLLKGEELPVCIGCDERLTIEYILLTRLSEGYQYFWDSVNFQITFGSVCILPTFKVLFLKIWLYTSFSKYIFLAFTVWWFLYIFHCFLYHLIWLTGCKATSYLLTT